MNQQLTDSINYLQDNGYILPLNGELTWTNKFKREYVPIASTSLQLVTQERSMQEQERVLSVEDVYRQFIKDAEVPYRVTTNTGGTYTVNAVSANAVREFTKIIRAKDREGNPIYNYSILVFSTKLYYTNPTQYKEKLTNYFIKGSWESQYNEFKEKLERGEVEHHINATLGGGSAMTNL